MSNFNPLKGLTTENKKTNFNPFKGIDDEPIKNEVSSTPVEQKPQNQVLQTLMPEEKKSYSFNESVKMPQVVGDLFKPLNKELQKSTPELEKIATKQSS